MTTRRGLYRCQKYLSNGAKAEWRRLAPKLIDSGVLNFQKSMLFEEYCEAFALWEKSVKDLQEMNAIEKNDHEPREKTKKDADEAFSRACEIGEFFGIVPFLPKMKKKRRKK